MIALYLKEIADCKPLTSLEERELAKRIHANDRQALNKLVNANLKFVISVCRNYQNQGLSLADLINEGNLGLIKAAKLFDETKEFRFISYAVWWIRQSILQALSEHSRLIKLPSNKIRILSKIQKCTIQLEHRLGRVPTAQEKAEALAVEVSVIEDNAQIPMSPVSLDAPLKSNAEKDLADFLVVKNESDPEEFIHDMQQRNAIEDILHTLNPKEKIVITLYFGIGFDISLTLGEIGHRMNLTRERVRQIKVNALRKLKHPTRASTLRTYANG